MWTKVYPRYRICIPLLHGLGCRRDGLPPCPEVKFVGFTPSFVRFVAQGGRFASDYRTGLRLSISVLLGHFVGSMVINSLALRIFYGYAWSVLLARIPNALVLSAVNIVLLRILLENRSLMKLAKK